MSKEPVIKIEGLKYTSEVGYPTPRDKDDEFESVFFLANDGPGKYTFRLGTYDFKEKGFRSLNGYGGEWWGNNVVAWAYWTDDDFEDEAITVTIEEK